VFLRVDDARRSGHGARIAPDKEAPVFTPEKNPCGVYPSSLKVGHVVGFDEQTRDAYYDELGDSIGDVLHRGHLRSDDRYLIVAIRHIPDGAIEGMRPRYYDVIEFRLVRLTKDFVREPGAKTWRISLKEYPDDGNPNWHRARPTIYGTMPL
jgi:hypothetical protein